MAGRKPKEGSGRRTSAKTAEKEWAKLGQAIREAREDLTMTPAELAAHARIDREQLEAVEAGRVRPEDALLEAVSRGLGLDREAFVNMNTYLIAFGKRTRAAREKLGISLDVAGRTTGLHRTAVYKIERGLVDVRITTLHSLARGLRVPPSALIESDGDE